MESAFSFNILMQSFILVITILLICFNLQQIQTIKENNLSLFVFMLGSLLISLLEITATMILKAKLTLGNKTEIYRASVVVSVLLNSYGIWGLYLMLLTPSGIPGLFAQGTHH